MFCLPRLLLSSSPTPTHPPSRVILFLPFESFPNFITLTKANYLLFQRSVFSSSLYFFDSSFFFQISSVFRPCVIHFFRKCEMSLTEYIMEDDFSKQSRHTNDHKLEREKEGRIKEKEDIYISIRFSRSSKQWDIYLTEEKLNVDKEWAPPSVYSNRVLSSHYFFFTPSVYVYHRLFILQ